MTDFEYVSFDTARLLRDAGYPQRDECKAYDTDEILNARLDEIEGEGYAAPHLWAAMKWLREERKLTIDVYLWHIGYNIAVCHFDRPTMDLLKGLYEKIPTYEQACDAGIAAACEWLINNQH